MPDFLADPSVLTKEKLKGELVANNVALPAGEQRKDVYVQLYLQHLTARNAGADGKGPPDFSSDEEREPTPVLGAGGAAGRSRAAAGRKATKKTDKPRLEEKDDLDVTELTNEDLQDQLVKYGVNPGPIVGTTRKLYEKKLLKLREQRTDSRSASPLPAASTESTRQNGSHDSDRYSDNEEGKKKEHKRAKPARELLPFSERPATPSGGFFQGISFPEISTRPPLSRTHLQAAKKAQGDPPRDPSVATTWPGRAQVQTLASEGNLGSSSRSSQGRDPERSPSAAQQELAARLVSATASPSLIKETTTTCYKDIVEHIFHGEKRGLPPVCTETSHVSESERSQVISPPLARAIREYVNSLLVQGGVGSLPGTSGDTPPLGLEAMRKRSPLSDFQETGSLAPPQKFPRLSEQSGEDPDPGAFTAFPDPVGSEISPLAKSVVSHSLAALGMERPARPQRGGADGPELSFPLHEAILKVIGDEWQQLDGQLPALACKYPVSSAEAPRILSVPEVDDEIAGLASGAPAAAGVQAACPESCDGQVEAALRRAYEAAAASLQAATHAAFVARALQADISQAAQALSSEPSRGGEAQDALRRAYDAATFLCEAAFDEVRMAARTMGSSTLGRRHLWLKGCKLTPASKNKLTRSPFKGGTLFGGEVAQVIKRRGKKY